ncbi:MAG: lactate dehydrogenase [Rhodothalassiaceae bacterium]|nr:MAG: lactate dehydrogenase [Rhodothalassiaceae bacterium]
MADDVSRRFDRTAFLAALEKRFGEKLSTAPAVREQHGRDESAHPAMPPDAVLFAESREDVVAAVRLCREHRAPLIPFGTGTSLEGHVHALFGGLSLDLSRMNRILEVAAEDQLAVVEAGVTREQLNTHLRDTGLFFPVDPGADASLGGMAATGASGTTTVRYGAMRENVRAMTVVTGTGEVVHLGSRARKSSAGYDLVHLMIGSEGTLGIITDLTVRLYGIPEAIAAGVIAFDDLERLVDAVILAIQSGLPLARIELVDELAMMAINHFAGLERPTKPHLFLEFHGFADTIAADIARFEQLAREFGGEAFEAETTTEGRNRLWKARHQLLYAGRQLNPGKLGLITDVCVPISKLAESIRETRRDLAESGIVSAIVGHVGDGNYHTTLWVDPASEEEIARARGVIARMAERALALGGTVTGEHGIGIGKKKLLEKEHGDAIGLMRAVKRALDPDGILNPGKIFDA